MSSTTAEIARLNAAGKVINFVVLMVSFIPGSIGLVLNMFVFTRPSLRRQPCSIYFLASTFCNLYIVFYMLPVRIASGSFDIDPASSINIVCKLQIFILFTLRSLSCWLIVLACADRYVISSASETWRRRISSRKVAIYASVLSTAFWFLMYCHMPIYFNISTINQFGQSVPQCVAQMGAYRTFVNLYQAFLYSVIPSLLIFLFGSLTFVNIRRQRRRVGPMVSTTLASQEKKNNQLLRMLSVQVLAIVLATIFYPIYLTYLSVTSSDVKSIRQVAVERLINLLVNGLTYIAHASSFYLYTLTGTVFRKEVVKIFLFCIHRGAQRRELDNMKRTEATMGQVAARSSHH